MKEREKLTTETTVASPGFTSEMLASLCCLQHAYNSFLQLTPFIIPSLNVCHSCWADKAWGDFFFSSSLSEAKSSPNVSPLGSDPASLEALAGALTMNMRSRCLGRCQAVLLVHALLPAVRTQGCSVGSCWDSRGAGAGLGPSQVHFQQQRQMLGLQWDQFPSVC